MHWVTGGWDYSEHGPDDECRKNWTVVLDQPLLFDMHRDPGEWIQLDLSKHQPVVVHMEGMKQQFERDPSLWGPSQTNRGRADMYAPCAPFFPKSANCTPFPTCCHKQ
jgi:hypothetical protein